MSKAAELLQLL